MTEEIVELEPNRVATVLVVEDDVFVRLAAAEDLRAAGYEVLEAASGDEALSLLRAGLAVDLVFSDVQMPGSLDGTALLAALRADFPAIAGVLTSGVARPAAAEGWPFLPKPYRRDELLSLVAQHVSPPEREAVGDR